MGTHAAPDVGNPDVGNNEGTDAEGLVATGLAASLTVKDVERSRNWYRDVLGFTVSREQERDGKLQSAAVTAGTVRILLNQDDGAKGADRTLGDGFSLMISTAQDVDVLAQHARTAGATLALEPTDTPWGTRAFRITDPDGYKFAISKAR